MSETTEARGSYCDLLKALQKTFAGCGVPCAREGTPLGNDLPCVRWKLNMTGEGEGTVTLYFLYRDLDLTVIEAFRSISKKCLRGIRTPESALIWMLDDSTELGFRKHDPGVEKMVLRLHMKTWPGLEVAE